MRVALLRVAVFFVCIIMGVNAPTIYAQLGTFKSTGPMVVNRTGPTVTLLHNGTVLVTGGSDGANALSSAEIFNPVSGTFRLTKGSMSTPRYGNTATLLSDGRVLIEGGYDHIPTASDPALDSAEIYDPDTDSFLPAGRMQTRHTLNRAKEVLLNNGQVLLAGGEANWTASGCFPVLSTAQLFDPNTNRFSFTTGNLTTSRQESEETLLLTGRVLLSGGFDTNCNILGSAELYDPASQTFTSTGNLNFSRLGHTSTLLPDGRVLVTGGLPGISLISAESYANGVFTSSNGTLTHSRFNHTATLLDDGTVLLVGGTGDGGSSKAAEIYDPVTDSFRPTVGSMASPYSGHRAVKLRNGNVLLIGGGNPEIYIFTTAQESNSVWPMTGHDPQRTGLSPFTGPKSAPAKPSWTYPTGAAVIGDLAISAEGMIYFTSDKLYAIKSDGTPLVPAVAISALTSPVVDDSNGLIYVIANNSVRGYDVLRYSKQLQNPVVIYHGDFVFVVPTSMTLGPDGTIYFSDGVSIIAAGARNWRSVDRPCFGNPGFLAPILGRDGSIYSMCQSGGGAGFGSGVYRFDGNTGAQLASSGYNRGGTELIIDGQNRIRAGYQAFNGIIFTGSYDSWDINLNQLTPTSLFDFTTSRSAFMPDGFSTVKIGFSFQSNELDATGAHIWGVPSGSQTLPNFSTVPTVDAEGNIFVGTVAGLAALSGLDGHVIWFSPVLDIITTQPAVSPDGSLIVGSSSGTIYAFASKPTTGTIIVSTDNSAAVFTISDGGSNTFTGSGTSFTQTAPAGKYTITFEPIAGFITPPPETKTLDSNSKIEFIASYLQHITVSPNTLEFNYPRGAAGIIPQQELSVQTSATPVHLSISTSTETGGNWLSISGTTLTTPANILVGVNNSLPEGQYRGAVHIHAFGGVDSNDLIVPVSLTVGSPAAVQINVELLDPSPVVENMQIVGPDTPAHISLLSSSSLQPLEGAATDGVSKLLVRISVSQPGETVLFLTDSLGKVSLPSKDAGTIPSDTLPTVGDNKVFAVYAAPNQFVRSQVPSDADASQRQVYLRVVFIPPNSPAIQSELFPIILERPPIILVHGLWSDDGAWDSFPLTSSVNCADTGKLYACRINYGPDAASSFAVIASEVGPVLRAKIAQFRKDRHVAALQADVIAHSMGGDIVRILPLCNNTVPACTFTYKTSANLGLGDVHSLVTIGTPHRGTPIANDLIQHLNTRCCPYLTCFGRGPLFKDAFRAQNGNSLDAGAVQDLQENSTAINAIQNATADFPMHFVVGIANSTDESLLDQGLVKTIRDQCSSSILPEHIRSIFNMDSDLLVSESSQRNSSVVVSPSHCVTRSLNLIHTNLLINPGQTGFSPDELTSQTLGLNVLKLLDSSASFCK